MKLAAPLCCWLALASHAVAGDVALEIREGRVSLDARNALVRDILAEWIGVGDTTIPNLDRIGNLRVTLQLTEVSERQAIETILRGVSGYVAVERAAAAPGASAYSRILVLPVSVAPPPMPAASRQSRLPVPPAPEAPDEVPGSVDAPRTAASPPPSRTAVAGDHTLAQGTARPGMPVPPPKEPK